MSRHTTTHSRNFSFAPSLEVFSSICNTRSISCSPTLNSHIFIIFFGKYFSPLTPCTPRLFCSRPILLNTTRSLGAHMNSKFPFSHSAHTHHATQRLLKLIEHHKIARRSHELYISFILFTHTHHAKSICLSLLNTSKSLSAHMNSKFPFSHSAHTHHANTVTKHLLKLFEHH